MGGELVDFPCCARCTGKGLHVLVACPKECCFGDVRKTLAALINTPFSCVNIGPLGNDDLRNPSKDGVFPSDAPVQWNMGNGCTGTLSVAILKNDGNGFWVPC